MGYRLRRMNGFGVHAMPRFAGRWLLAALLAVLSCAPVRNFTDPQGPGLMARHAPARADSAGAGTPLRIVTMNVKFAEKIPETIALFRESPDLRGADVILLQEMDDRGVERMAKALRMNAVYYAASIHPSTRKTFGPAVLTPWPVERGWKVILPHQGYARGQRRTATGAVIRIRGISTRVYSVHLETLFRLGEGRRRDQVRVVLEDAGDAAPLVVGGDMNDDQLVTTFEACGLVWATREAGPTMGIFAFDHIYLRGSGEYLGTIRCGTVDPRGASDHKATWVTIPGFQ